MYDLQTRSSGQVQWVSGNSRITWWSLYWWLQNEWERRGGSSHQSPLPERWDNLPPAVQKTARQQHHLCCWGYSHLLGTELLPVHGSSSPRFSCLLWLNILFAGYWEWKQREPLYLPYYEPPLFVEWQRYTCSFLLDTKTLWHGGKWKSRSADKRDPWPWYRPTGKCPLCRFEAIGHLLCPLVGPDQVGCGCTLQRSIYLNQYWGQQKNPALDQRTPATCPHCEQTLAIDHTFLEGAVLRKVVTSITQLTNWILPSS